MEDRQLQALYPKVLNRSVTCRCGGVHIEGLGIAFGKRIGNLAPIHNDKAAIL